MIQQFSLFSKGASKLTRRGFLGYFAYKTCAQLLLRYTPFFDRVALPSREFVSAPIEAFKHLDYR